MEKAYIILAHKSPAQLHRLVKRLDDGHAAFFVHIDKKTDLSAFNELKTFGNKVKLTKRVATNWGCFGLVGATLIGLRAVKETNRNFERIILLSGQDYPIKSNQEIDMFLKNNPGKVFLEYTTIPDFERWKPRGGMYRIDKYFLGLKPHERYTAKTLNLLADFLPPFKRKLPKNMMPYAGSQWWMIDMYALNYILNYVKNNSNYAAFHQSTFAPDELFFHNILLNAKDKRLSDSIVNDNKRYINWKDSFDCHPKILVEEDMEDIINSNALFARKFDEETDTKIFDLIDRYCLNKGGASFNKQQ